jgi:hypothetical protein
MSLSKYQLERADLTVTIEQGRRVEQEVFRENGRFTVSTMGDLLRQRYFGQRVNVLNWERAYSWRQLHPPAARSLPPEPHQWPCGDPYCQPCDDAVKRLLRDVGVLPRKGGTR